MQGYRYRIQYVEVSIMHSINEGGTAAAGRLRTAPVISSKTSNVTETNCNRR